MKTSSKNQVVTIPDQGNELERKVKIYTAVAFIYIYFLTAIFL